MTFRDGKGEELGDLHILVSLAWGSGQCPAVQDFPSAHLQEKRDMEKGQKGQGKRSDEPLPSCRSLCPPAETESCLGLELSWSICRLWTGDAALHLPEPRKSEEGVAFFLLHLRLSSGQKERTSLKIT